MDYRVDLLKILKDEGKMETILLYPANTTIADPYEQNTEKSFLNPSPIKAYVTQVSFESLKWKYYGQLPNESVQIICENKYESILKIADKIKIKSNWYRCYKTDSKGFSIMHRENYLVVILEKIVE